MRHLTSTKPAENEATAEQGHNQVLQLHELSVEFVHVSVIFIPCSMSDSSM